VGLQCGQIWRGTRSPEPSVEAARGGRPEQPCAAAGPQDGRPGRSWIQGRGMHNGVLQGRGMHASPPSRALSSDLSVRPLPRALNLRSRTGGFPLRSRTGGFPLLSSFRFLLTTRSAPF